MSDADGKIIPWVDGDQGEGIKDFIESPEPLQQEVTNCPRIHPYEDPKRRISSKEYKLPPIRSTEEMLDEILDRIGELERFIKQAIGNHVLIHGEFKELKFPL
jgi:hypothetical protein